MYHFLPKTSKIEPKYKNHKIIKKILNLKKFTTIPVNSKKSDKIQKKCRLFCRC